jgi:hypothetical protein
LFRGNRAITVAVACRELNNLSHFSQFLLIIIELHSSNTVTNRLQTRQQNFPLNSPPDLRFFSLYFQFLARPTKTTGPSIVRSGQTVPVTIRFKTLHSETSCPTFLSLSAIPSTSFVIAPVARQEITGAPQVFCCSLICQISAEESTLSQDHSNWVNKREKQSNVFLTC